MGEYKGLLPDDLLDTVVNLNVPTIRLTEFAQGFWLAFTGRIEDPVKAREILAFWIQRVAGNPSIAVDVIHDVTGEKIARIPPLLSSGNASNLVAIFDDIRKAKEMSKLDTPDIASTRLEQTKSMLFEKYSTTYLKDSIDDWAKLYTIIEGKAPEDVGVEDIEIGDVGSSDVTELDGINKDTLNDIEWE